MTWSQERRLDFIDWRLAVYGTICRADIMARFDVGLQQASQDLQAFLAAHPGAMDYDKSAKRYVPSKQPYRSRRGWTPSAIGAMAGLAEVHEMGWR